MADWLAKFKLAIINEDADAICDLVASFDNKSVSGVQNLREAQGLLSSAAGVLKKRQNELKSKMQNSNKLKQYMF